MFALVVCFALMGFASLAVSQTLVFDESNLIQSHPKKAGINLQPPANYGANELYKNLLWLNPGFEPTLLRQKLVASTANGGGSSTVFIPELFSNVSPYGSYNSPDLVAGNVWSGATFWLARSGTGSLQAKSTVCSGTIAGNSAGTPTAAPQYTFSAPCSTAVQPGDILVLRRLTPCATDGITIGNGGWWLPVTTAANVLRTDCQTPYEGKQSLVLDATAAGSTSEIDSYIDDSSSQTNGVLLNGQYTISGYYKTYSGTNPTLTVAVNRKLPSGSQGNPTHWPGNQCTNNGTFLANSAWAAFSITCTGSETSDMAPSLLKIAFTASGGAVDLDSVSFYKSAGTDPTNTTVFRDEVVATLKAHCAGASLSATGVPCELRSSGNADGDEIDNTIKPMNLRSPATEGFEYTSSSRVGLEEFLDLCKLVGAEPYFTLPETMTISDAPHWIEYLYGTAATPYGGLRQANGQSSAWGSIFNTIHLEMGNENWNSLTGAGFNLLPDLPNSTVTPWAGDDPYFDYTTDTAGIWNAMRSDPSWPASAISSVDLVLNFQEHSWAGWVNLAMSRTGATSGELAAYTQASVNSVGSLTALWQPLMYEVVAKTSNPAMQFYQMMHGISIFPGILARGKVNIYEYDNGTVEPSTNLTQTVLDSFTNAAGYGTATALHALSNLAAGIVDQNFYGLSTYIGYPVLYKASYPITGSSATANVVTLASNNAFAAGDYACFSGLGNISGLNGQCAKVLASGLSSSYFQVGFTTANVNHGAETGADAVSPLYAHHWGAAIDMGGSTTTQGSTTGATLVRPQELGLRMANAAIIGPMYACTIANPTTAILDPKNQNGSEAAPSGQGYWTPPPSNSAAVPHEYAFCFMQGQQRSMILINTDVTNAHAVSFSAGGAPSGQVMVTRYAPASISQTNEAPGTELVTGYHPAVVSGQPSAVSTPSGDTLPPFSITRYDWSTALTSTSTVLTSSVTGAVTVGSAVTLTAAVSGNPTVGTVTFMDNGTPIGNPLPVTNGMRTLTYGNVAAGTHALVAAFNGVSGYASSISNTVSVTAGLIPTTATVTTSSSAVFVGQSVTLNAAVTSGSAGGTLSVPSGSIVFTLDGVTTLCTATLNGNGAATCTATLNSAGQHTIAATFNGVSGYASSISNTVSVTASLIPTTATVTTSSSAVFVGQSVTLNAAVTSGSAGGTLSVPSGSIVFTLDGVTTLCTATLNGNGAATCTATLNSAGQHTIAATFNGVSGYASSISNTVSVTASLIPTTATVTTSSSAVFVGQSVTLNAAVTSGSAGGTLSVPSGSIVFTLDGVTTLCTATLNGNGAATCTATLNSAGQHTIAATFNGVSGYASSISNTVSVTASLIPTTATVTTSSSAVFVGQSVTLNAAVTSGSAGGTLSVPSGSIVFTLDGVTTLCTATLNGNGAATCTATLNSAGQHTIAATFNGVSGYASSISNTVSVTASLIPTTATVTTSSSAVFVGQSVTLNAAVTSGSAGGTLSVPSGSIVFTLDGVTTLCTATLNGNGAATCTATLNSAGQHTIAAAYKGDATHSGASANVSVGVTNQTSLTLNTTPATAYTGQTVTLQANALAAGGSTAPNAGTIQFLDGGVVLGMAAVMNGSASFTTSALSVGTHVLTASYSGDMSDAPATSNAVTQVILSSDLVLSASQTSITLSAQQTLVFNVTATSIGTFADTVSFSASGIPGNVSAAFTSPQGIVTGGGSLPTSVRLIVTGYTAEATPLHVHSGRIVAAWIGFGFLPFTLVFTRLRRSLAGVLLVLSIMVLSFGMSGCASNFAALAPTNFTLHVVAKGSATGMTRSLDIPCTVVR